MGSTKLFFTQLIKFLVTFYHFLKLEVTLEVTFEL